MREHVLKVRLSDDELRQLDAAVGPRGGTRAGLPRRLIADGLLELGLAQELTLQDALAPFVMPGADWRAAAAALESSSPSAGPPRLPEAHYAA